ncbi:hypothetical protein Nepgr_028223 [Nepenthes gracilis]|uniref:Transcription repressor n=1 Tax=Nepenthes gracilis TaxID=150966 RepID=A0AAD3TBB2_NEPGR|nr:hypothetical protein Nepgr_028223 [Nepenthes gracilis]
MGSSRFRLSEMIPHAWFFKLKYMSSGGSKNQSQAKKKHSQTQQQTPPPTKSKSHAAAAAAAAAAAESQVHGHLSHSRKSYYFSRDLITRTDETPGNYSSCNYPRDPLRKSARKRTIKGKSTTKSSSTQVPVSSSVLTTCGCHATAASATDFLSIQPKSETSQPEISPNRLFLVPQSSPDPSHSLSAACQCRVHQTSGEADVIVGIDEKSLAEKGEKSGKVDSISRIELPPIITKPEKLDGMKNRAAAVDGSNYRRSSANGSESKDQSNSSMRRFSVNSPANGVRLRLNSPRIGRKGQGNTSGRRSSVPGSSRRRSILESFAIVKSSLDPQSDFRESMLEMIVQNNIRASKDLEELLACYLSLNSDDYHDLIIKVFKQIWSDLNDIKQSKVA